MQQLTRSRALPALMEELVEEILLRLPLEEPPAHLVRAAMVCKAWRRILSDGGFRRRYCRFHRATPTLLGYVCGVFNDAGPQFIPTNSYFSPPPLPTSCSYSAIDCRHGRVLIQVTSEDGSPEGFIIWSLVTGSRQNLITFPSYPRQGFCSFTGAVLCARHRHGCDHLDCHDGPFLVVLVGTHDPHPENHAVPEHHVMHTWASVYSSETGAWSAQTYSTDKNCYSAGGWTKPSLLIGDTLYFTIACHVIRILKYDLGGHGLSVIDTPPQVHKAVPIDVDGRLGIVQSHCSCIYTWSWQVDAHGVGEWVRRNVVVLETLIPTIHDVRCPDDTIHFAEGTNTVFLCLYNLGVFTLDLNSRQVREVNFNKTCDHDVLPYVSFYIPADFAKGKLSS
ncbi:unnamed protein product [Urochloa decumbens]|uniref:F-box domain-containing protein n=1 Tax=Urochloa decumbens TaxID=240449 RepID=A0ABC9DAG2_9POAL